ADAIVLGPGLGRGDPRTRFALALLERARAPVVIDADALQVPGVRSAGAAPRVLTPHPGEFAAQFPELAEEDRFVAPTAALALIGRTGGPSVRRSGQRSGGQAVRQSARRSGPRSAGPPVRRSALLLKGVPTVIASGSALRVVAAGNPALATGGTGDVLAGTIAAWLARGLTPLDAATLGAHTMGRAAELAARERGARATRPEDVVAQYPRLWEHWRALPPPEPPVLLRLEPPAVS
ncbi:MAG TPA: ADP/ATP-dependent (S)-NAD(P)H-hydrate dehydratase, partial [Gemmatimonadales bacterium]|nr:ADP/ATP-dependent (S)-NAD(P)H-hydrate dehydratase [Gemmatimonadales bacterium]